MFIIEDEIHSEWQEGRYMSFDEVIAELRRLSSIAWDKEPNSAPCMSWKTCGRNYEIVEYDTSEKPWKELRRIPALNISAEGIKWLIDSENK